jgi:hypothetical protein
VLGGGGEGDVVAEGLEVLDVVAGGAVAVDLPGVPVGAEVGVAGAGVGEEVPDDGEDGAGDGDLCPGAADAAGSRVRTCTRGSDRAR